MIRLALIGGGETADAYGRIATRLRDAAFAAVAEADPAAATRRAARLGAPIVASGLDELLSKYADSFDAIVVHSATAWRAGEAQRAAAAGKHVLIEAPLAVSTAEAERVIAAATAAGVRLMAGHVDRFRPSIQAVKQCLDEGKLGEPGLVRIHRWLPRGEPGYPPAPGGGPDHAESMLRRVVREIDLACWLFAERPTHIYAAGTPADPRQRALDYIQLHLGFSGGGMALIDCAATLPAGDGYFSLSLISSAGAAYADDHHDTQLVFQGGAPKGVKTDPGPLHLLAQLTEFIDAIARGREPVVTGADGATAVQLAEAVAASLAAGKVIHLNGACYESD